MEIDILNEKGNGLLGRNVSIVLNLAKKELNKGNDRNFYDILVAMVEEIKPYIQKEYPSDSDSDSPNTWHTGTPTEDGTFLVLWKDTEEQMRRFSVLHWNEYNDTWYDEETTYCNWGDEDHAEVIAWQKIEPYKETD